MQRLARRVPLTAAQHHAIENRIRKVELLQTLIARNQAALAAEAEHQANGASARLHEEIQRLWTLRQHVARNPDTLDAVLTEMGAYRVSFR